VSQHKPIFLQRDGRATNIRVGSPKSGALKFAKSICAYCNNTVTQPYDAAWQHLSEYLQLNWQVVRRRGQFNLSAAFPGGTRSAALNVHLYFVKMLGCKIFEEKIRIDLATFSAALLHGRAHPEVRLLVAEDRIGNGRVLFWDSEVHVMSNQHRELHGAIWLYLAQPVAIKVSYIKAGAPLHTPGYPWHPERPGKIVRLSTYLGGTEPNAGREAILSSLVP
jgi:hypothetical protein